MRTELTTPLIVLLLVVGLLLAIACANIASLLLARATTRSREMAIRLSMGAGRGRLIRQLLTESLLLASVGGVLGLALAYWGSTALLTFLTRGGPVTGIDVRPDWRVIGLTFATSMATALAFGLLPALRGTRVPLAESLKAQTRSVIGAAGHGGRVPVGKLLIAGQMAVAILLLLVAALFVRSLQALVQVDVGYDRDHVLVARIDPRSSGYTVAELPALYTRVVERLARLPGVVAVSVSANGPFSGSRNRGDFSVEGYTPARDEQMTTLKDWVTSDYFRTVGLAITQGRGFGPEDSANSRRVSVISETMARRYFPQSESNREALGDQQQLRRGRIRDRWRRRGCPLQRREGRVGQHGVHASDTDRAIPGNVEVRAAGNPTALTNAVRNALRESEPRLAVGAIETLDSRIARSIGVERLLGWLTMAFGAAALAWCAWVSTGRFRTRSGAGPPSWACASRLAPTAWQCSGSSCVRHCCSYSLEEPSGCHSHSSPHALSAVCCTPPLRPIPLRTGRRSACSSLFLRSRRISRHGERRASIRWWRCGPSDDGSW